MVVRGLQGGRLGQSSFAGEALAAGPRAHGAVGSNRIQGRLSRFCTGGPFTL